MNYLPQARDQRVTNTKTVENLKTGEIKTSENSFTVKVVRTSGLPSKVNGKFRNGWLNPTPRSRWSSSNTVPIGNYWREYTTLGVEYRETNSIISSFINIGSVMDSNCAQFPYNESANLRNRVRAEVTNKLSDQKVNYGQAILEAKESFGTIAQTLTRVLRSYRALRSGNVQKAFKYLAIDRGHKLKSKDFGSRWLELQFGWKPLLSDIYGTYELLQDGLRRGYLPLRVVRELKQPFHYEKVTSVSGERVDLDYKGTLSHKIVLWYYIDDELLSWASSLGLLNPAQLAWEKLPFSFVIDWALPIGTFLSAATATLGIKILSGTETTRCEYRCTATCHYYESSAECQGEGVGYKRMTLSSFPLVLPYVKSPLSGSHVVSALALLQQLRK